MVSVCFYFQVHQPWRIRHYTIFDIGKNHDYFDALKNEDICKKVASKCYVRTNKLMLDLIKRKHGKFRISYSISGVALEQFEEFAPEVIESFKELAKTGCVEFLSETYYHSLSFLYDKDEFKHQVMMHKKKIQDLFGITPTVFRNTELIYNNELAKTIEDMGYEGILAEGVDSILDWKSPNFLYRPKGCDKLALLLKNYKLSDDIAFRFSDKNWKEHPLTADKFNNWLSNNNGNGEIVNLFMDYETFGEHQWEDSGIFNFLDALPKQILQNKDNEFLTPHEVVQKYDKRDELDIHNFISWADFERDLSAWLGNEMQKNAIKELYELGTMVKSLNDDQLLIDWRRLTTSDHFYYMCTKYAADGDVHKYFNPYDSPYDAYINFINVLNDIIIRIKEKELSNPQINAKAIISEMIN